MENLFGGLVTLENDDKYDEFIDSIDEKIAKKIIELALLHAQAQGLFNIKESHCLYECMKLLENKD